VSDRKKRPERAERDITVVEVAPRDGLQNEPAAIPTHVKIAFIEALAAAGAPVVEATSFVNPTRVPRLADASEVMTGIRRVPTIRYVALVPNQRGLERALGAGVDAIALFASATEEFSQANVGGSIAESFARFEPVAAEVMHRGMWMRGYVSVAFGCPYSGNVPIGAVVSAAERLQQLGCHQICLADTIGSATPALTADVLGALLPSISAGRVALHFHDTSGTALANVDVALSAGIRTFDAAASGLGGCPFAPGAPGNLATERLVAHLEELGVRTGVSLDGIHEAAAHLHPYIPRIQPVHS
jgi:hydroxymethylglutaryl-CoA lyase